MSLDRFPRRWLIYELITSLIAFYYWQRILISASTNFPFPLHFITKSIQCISNNRVLASLSFHEADIL